MPFSQCESTGRVGPSNPRLLGDERTRALSRGDGSSSGAARPQAVEDVSHHLRAQYDLLERGDANGENPRVERGVDSSLSGAAMCITMCPSWSRVIAPCWAQAMSSNRSLARRNSV